MPVLLLILAFINCQNNFPVNKKVSVEKDTIQIHTLNYSSDTPSCKLSIDYVVLSGMDMDSLERIRNAEFLAEATQTRKSLTQEADKLYSNYEDCRSSEEDFAFRITPGLLTPYCISYSIEKTGTAFCAPHSFHSYDFRTIDLNTGKPLTLKNIFNNRDSAWAKVIATKARQGYLEESLGFKPSGTILFEAAGYYTNNDFVLEDTAISFLIDPITIHESLDGQSDFWMTIPYSELKSVIPPGSLLWEKVN
ncbi:MAG: hypothetical protein HY064_01275 [Bacteroidetes bacterium]|nr:hypothetical protein [Bacteroidota bacterium]